MCQPEELISNHPILPRADLGGVHGSRLAVHGEHVKALLGHRSRGLCHARIEIGVTSRGHDVEAEIISGGINVVLVHMPREIPDQLSLGVGEIHVNGYGIVPTLGGAVSDDLLVGRDNKVFG